MTGVITAILRKEDGKRTGGYFFIRDEQDFDRFAHAYDLRDFHWSDLREGMTVEFVPLDAKTGKGNSLRAEKVRVTR